MNLFSASKFIRKLGGDVDVFAGVHNPYVAMAAQRLGKKCVLFTDTPGSKMVNRFSVERASTVCTPDCLSGMFSRQVTYPGYKEMAYLHPRVFRPEPGVLAENSLKPGEKYYMVRYIKWSAYHDKGMKGMSAEEKKELVKALAGKGKVLFCSEGGEPNPVPGVGVAKPEHVHSLLYYSSGYVGEGATMAKEAALLGVPSVYASPIRGLPPIDKLAKEGRLVQVERYDLDAIMKPLVGKKPQMQMFDLTAEIVRRAGES